MGGPLLLLSPPPLAVCSSLGGAGRFLPVLTPAEDCGANGSEGTAKPSASFCVVSGGVDYNYTEQIR